MRSYSRCKGIRPSIRSGNSTRRVSRFLPWNPRACPRPRPGVGKDRLVHLLIPPPPKAYRQYAVSQRSCSEVPQDLRKTCRGLWNKIYGHWGGRMTGVRTIEGTTAALAPFDFAQELWTS